MDAVRTADDQIANLPDSVIDARVVQALRIVAVAAYHLGKLRRQAGRAELDGALDLAAAHNGHYARMHGNGETRLARHI